MVRKKGSGGKRPVIDAKTVNAAMNDLGGDTGAWPQQRPEGYPNQRTSPSKQAEWAGNRLNDPEEFLPSSSSPPAEDTITFTLPEIADGEAGKPAKTPPAQKRRSPSTKTPRHRRGRPAAEKASTPVITPPKTMPQATYQPVTDVDVPEFIAALAALEDIHDKHPETLQRASFRTVRDLVDFTQGKSPTTAATDSPPEPETTPSPPPAAKADNTIPAATPRKPDRPTAEQASTPPKTTPTRTASAPPPQRRPAFAPPPGSGRTPLVRVPQVPGENSTWVDKVKKTGKTPPTGKSR